MPYDDQVRIHADYSQVGGPLRLALYDDRLEVELVATRGSVRSHPGPRSRIPTGAAPSYFHSHS